MLCDWAEMVVVPHDKAVTRPVALIVATAELLDAQVAVCVRSVCPP